VEDKIRRLWKHIWLEEKYQTRTKNVSAFERFIDFTDTKWHELENKYFGLVNPILSEEAFRMELIRLGKFTLSGISKDIKGYLDMSPIRSDHCQGILELLTKEIP
jgi:hypothetical protein